MNCREFRRQHDADLDDTLSGFGREAMARHRSVCDACARRDTRLRRALLVVHNLPAIEPSARFSERLQRRLAHERALMAMTHASPGTIIESWWRPLSTGAYAAMAAGVLVAAVLAATVVGRGSERDVIRLAPVVATRPAPEPSTLATPVTVASMSTGMTVWPALYVAQQAPWHLASDAAER